MSRLAVGVRGLRKYAPYRATLIVCCATLGGCGGTMGLIDGPPKWATSPASNVKCKEGEDLVKCHAKLKQEYARERSKRRALQRYAKAVSG